MHLYLQSCVYFIFISTGSKFLYEAHSLGTLGYLEPLNMPKEQLQPVAQAQEPDVFLSSRQSARSWGSWTAVFKMGKRERLLGSQWEFQCYGNLGTCRGIPRDSDPSPTESPRELLISEQSWEKSEDWGRYSKATGGFAQAAVQPGHCLIWLWELLHGNSGTRHPDTNRARTVGLDSKPHTYPIIAYL